MPGQAQHVGGRWSNLQKHFFVPILYNNPGMSDMTESTKSSILLCQLQSIPICIARQYITKAILLPAFTIVPNAPPYLAGLINLAGQSVPLIDLAFKLGMIRKEPYKRDTPILICKHEQSEVGIIVDEIMGFAEVDNAQIHSEDLASQEQAFIAAAITIEANIFLLIDIPKIAAIHEGQAS